MMKERYLHQLDVSDLRGREISCLRNGRPALLVLDMQEYFLSSESHAFIPSAPDLVPVLTGMAEAFGSRGFPVLFTRHLNTREDSGSMGRWWRESISRDNPLSEICSAFHTSPGEVLEKPQYDAFLHTGLQERLLDDGVTSVVVTGVMTNLCCETTARSAFTRGFDVVFPVDCTATCNMELHMATILNLSHGFTKPECGESVMNTVLNAR